MVIQSRVKYCFAHWDLACGVKSNFVLHTQNCLVLITLTNFQKCQKKTRKVE